MTELNNCDLNERNGISHGDHADVNGKNMVAKNSTKPSGIPRLFVHNSQRHNPNSVTDDVDMRTNPQNFTPEIRSETANSEENSKQKQCIDDSVNGLNISSNLSKRSSRDTFLFNSNKNAGISAQNDTLSLNRHNRAASEENQGRKSVGSSNSELTNNSRSTGAPNHVITSKIGSLSNTRHKPGGGNVKIIENKVDFSNVEARCGSKKNINYKPGGGDVEIVSRKLEFTKTAEPKVNSLKNVKYQPQGGDVKIDNRKLEWNTHSKVGSFNNLKHKPGGGSVQIVTQQLPWLKYNKPNLPAEEIAKIEKKAFADTSKQSIGSPYSNSQCSDHSR